jgi:hypothetical protein
MSTQLMSEEAVLVPTAPEGVSSSPDEATSPYATLYRALEACSGHAVDGMILPFLFSGLDYAVVLISAKSVPLHVKENLMNHLCWAESPAESQLQDNLTLFTESAKALLPVDCGEDWQLTRSVEDYLNTVALQPLPKNLAKHIAVQRWLIREVVASKGMCDTFDPADLRRRMRLRLNASLNDDGAVDDGHLVAAAPYCVACGNRMLAMTEVQAITRMDQLSRVKREALSFVEGSSSPFPAAIDWGRLLELLRVDPTASTEHRSTEDAYQ